MINTANSAEKKKKRMTNTIIIAQHFKENQARNYFSSPIRAVFFDHDEAMLLVSRF
jgi:hypothetical protein